ncbi:MAG TPA: glycosyltransferase family 39 protein [Coriobacteriia bacterium]|jgi:hypothetical protein
MDPAATTVVNGPDAIPDAPESELRRPLRERLTWDHGAMVLVVLGAILRFADLGRQSMWYDELFTMLVTTKSLPGLMRIAIEDTTPPFYYILQHFLIRAFGISEVTMRFLPALAGVITIWVVYLLGKRLFSPKVGFWAAGLMTVGALPLRYSQEARAYSFMMLFAALSLLALASLAEKPGVFRAALFGLSLAALAYSHVYGAFGCLAIVLAMLALPSLRRGVGWWGAGAAGLAALSYVPWALIVLTQIRTVGGWVQGGTWGLRAPASLGDEFARTLANLTPWPTQPAVLPALAFTGLLVAGLLGTASAPQIARHAKKPSADGSIPERDALWLLGAAAVVPVMTGLLLTRYVVPIHDLRNCLVALPAVYVLVAVGATRLKGQAGTILIAALVAYAVFGLGSYYTSTSKGHWREAVTYLLDRGAQHELVIASSDYVPLDVNMYSVVLGHPKQFPLATVGRDLDGKNLDKALGKALKGRTSVYVVTAFVHRTGVDWTTFDDGMKRAGWKVAETRNFDFLPLVRHWMRQR